MHRKGFSTIIIVLEVVGVLIVAGAIYYFTRPSAPVADPFVVVTQSSSTPYAPPPPVVTPNQIPSSTQFNGFPTSTTTSTPIIPTSTSTTTPPAATSSTQIVIADQYGLFAQQSKEKKDGFMPATKYFDDGVIAAGNYNGYRRIIGWRSSESTSTASGTSYVFATKDNQNYYLDTGTDKTAAADLQSKDSVFNKGKVIAVDSIALNHPATIPEGNFVLTRKEVEWNGIAPGVTTAAITVSGLQFFVNPLTPMSVDPALISNSDYTNFVKAFNQYLTSDTRLLAKDAMGLVYSYAITTVETIGQGNIHANALYNGYGKLMPFGCGNTSSTSDISYILNNVSASDLTKLATTPHGVDVYVLTDQNHILYRAEYYAKIIVSGKQASLLLKDYVAKNPILIFKDPLGRWMALGESEYQPMGLCGK